MRSFAQTRATRSRGVASLEFVLVFPILLMLTAVIFWVGGLVVEKSRVVIRARAGAWTARHDDRSAKPFDFTVRGDVQREASGQAPLRPPFLRSMTPTPKSHHLVLAGTWDHRDVPLDRPPHWELAGTLAASTPGQVAGNVTDTASNLGELLDVQGILGGVVASQLGQQTGMQSELLDWWDKLTGSKKKVQDKKEQDRQKLMAELPGKIAGYQEKSKMLQMDLNTLEETRKTLQQEIDEERDQKTGKKLDKAALEARQNQLKQAEARIKDLEQQINEQASLEARDQGTLNKAKAMEGVFAP